MTLNNIGISQRCTGIVDENGYVTVTKIDSYDLVGSPGFTGATLQDFDEYYRELLRQELLKSRREKINRLNNISDFF